MPIAHTDKNPEFQGRDDETKIPFNTKRNTSLKNLVTHQAHIGVVALFFVFGSGLNLCYFLFFGADVRTDTT